MFAMQLKVKPFLSVAGTLWVVQNTEEIVCCIKCLSNSVKKYWCHEQTSQVLKLFSFHFVCFFNLKYQSTVMRELTTLSGCNHRMAIDIRIWQNENVLSKSIGDRQLTLRGIVYYYLWSVFIYLLMIYFHIFINTANNKY